MQNGSKADTISRPGEWSILLCCIINNNADQTDRESMCLQIAKNIDPLVNCMIDDVKRVFFKSKGCWHDSVSPFLCLVHIILVSSGITKDCFCRHKGLVDMVIQSIFYEMQRPDIVKDMKQHVRRENRFSSIIETALGVMNAWVSSTDQKEHLDFIARTPIRSETYSPDIYAVDNFLVGLVKLLGSPLG